jgi:hypothetical protein
MDEALFERFCLITAENDRLTDALASMKRQRDRLMGALEGDATYSDKEKNHWQYLAKHHEEFFGASKVKAKEAKEAVSKLRSAINGMLSSKSVDAVSSLQAMKDAFLETASLDPNSYYELDSRWDED